MCKVTHRDVHGSLIYNKNGSEIVEKCLHDLLCIYSVYAVIKMDRQHFILQMGE